MILDTFKLHNLIVQIDHRDCFELWDHAGKISQRICSIWPDLKLSDANPQLQILIGKGLNIQTGLKQSTITITDEKALSQNKISQIKETFDIWREELKFDELNRVSTRSQFVKKFPTIQEANNELLELNLVKWPTTNVFDQSEDAELNTFELRYRFQDQASFTTLLVKTEQIIYQVDLDPTFIDETEIRKTVNRMMLDFDRGLLGTVSVKKFRMDEWLKGYYHLLRRDIEKVIGNSK